MPYCKTDAFMYACSYMQDLHAYLFGVIPCVLRNAQMYMWYCMVIRFDLAMLCLQASKQLLDYFESATDHCQKALDIATIAEDLNGM